MTTHFYIRSSRIFTKNILNYNTALEACLEAEEEARILDTYYYELKKSYKYD